MNNGNPSGPQSGQPNLNNLIKPEQLQGLQYFPDEQKPKYHQGITKLWETINTNQKESQTYQQAFKKLYEVTMNVRKTIQERKDKAVPASVAGAPQNNGRPQSQQGPQANQPSNQGEAPQQQQKSEQYSAKIMEKVESLTVVIPPAFLGPDSGPTFVKDMKKKYAQALHTYERAEQQLSKMIAMQTQRNGTGKPFNQQEQATFEAQSRRCQQQKDSALEYLRGFQKSQEGLKASMQRAQAGNSENVQNGPVPKQEGNPGMGSTSQAPEHQGQAHTVSSALDAARSQANNVSGRPSAMSPPNNNSQPQQAAIKQPPNPQQPQAPPHSQAQLNNIKAEAQPHQNSPGMAPSQPVASHHHGDPQPLKHEDALEKARSYSNGPGYPQNTPQSATHAHPPQHNQRESQPSNHSKMPVPRDLPHVPPQPVSMGQSRPTMTNGPLVPGPIGSPAIHRTPGYVLEGDGERVLSKKKLEELVRQVTGGTGGENEDNESITADVEEVNPTQFDCSQASSLKLS